MISTFVTPNVAVERYGFTFRISHSLVQRIMGRALWMTIRNYFISHLRLRPCDQYITLRRFDLEVSINFF
jgi:hypothetical protein